jgi:hypothetical protein
MCVPSRREQQEREERDRLRKLGLLPPEQERREDDHYRGVHDAGDPNSTNVYVGNLSQGGWALVGLLGGAA